MFKTKQELLNEVLQELNAAGSGQQASAEDRADVLARLDSTLNTLAARRVYYVANTDEIDSAAFNHLVRLLVNECGPKFGRAYDNAVRESEEAMLRVLSRIGKGTGQGLRVDSALRPQRRFGGGSL